MQADEKIKTQRDSKSLCPEVLILKEMQIVKESPTLTHSNNFSFKL